jgi:hypothetical protein
LLKGVLYRFNREIHSPEEIARELQDGLLYPQCGFDYPPSDQSVHRFLTDIALVVEDVFRYLVEQVATRDLLDKSIGSMEQMFTPISVMKRTHETTIQPLRAVIMNRITLVTPSKTPLRKSRINRPMKTVVATTTDMVVSSPRQVEKYRLQQRSLIKRRSNKRRRGASRRMRSPSATLAGYWVMESTLTLSVCGKNSLIRPMSSVHR